MVALDWIFLGVLGVSLLLGAWRGLVFEMLSLSAWVVAFVAAQWFAADVAQWLPMTGSANSLRYAAGFLLTFVVAAFAGGLIAVLVKKMTAVAGLAPVDRVLGSVFGLVRGVVLLLAAAVVIAMTPLHTSVWWNESVGAGFLGVALKGLKPLVPQEFGKYLP
jgi:membrane protein required for colicin V production